MLDPTLRIITVFGFGFLLTLCFGQLVVKKKTNRHWLFAGLYFGLATLLFANVNVDSQMNYVFPAMALVDIPLLFTIGPFIHIIFKDTLPNEEVNINRDWYHFILAFIALLAMIPVWTGLHVIEANRIALAFKEGQTQQYDYVYFAGLVHACLYILFSLKKITPALRLTVLKEEVAIQHVAFIIIFSTIVIILAILAAVFQEYVLLRLSVAVVALGMTILFIFSHRYPDLYQSFITIIRQTKPTSKSHLEGVNIGQLESDLKELMEMEKIFKDEHLTLSKLANQLGITLHQLSQFLNQHYKRNFSSFINEHRIEEAKNELAATDKTVLSIAYDVGFNSISSFNRGFKRVTDQTPKEYRQKNQKKR